MDGVHEQFGTINPDASAALARFAFLVGRWKCDARIKLPDGNWATMQASWLGRFILDGHAIADEYRMTDSSGRLIVLGMNFRTYDAASKRWNLRWLDALTGRWVDLAPDELGGVTSEGPSVAYAFKEPMADHSYTRATYTSISDKRFTWRGEKSEDGRTWSEFMVVDCAAADR
jgi:hypothetical protein